MERDHERRGSWVGWAFAVAAVVCLIAAANSWHVWRSFAADDPAGWMTEHTWGRMLFWLTCAGVAALAAGVVWAVRRWGSHDAEDPDRLSSGGAPLAGGAAGIGTAVVVDAGSTTRLDWKVPTSPRPLHWTDRLRWVLGLGWVALLVAGVLLGERVSTVDDARAAVASGSVREVQVAGALAAGEGTARQEVTWQDGWTRHRAEVTWSSTSDGVTGSDGVTVLGREVADVLTEARPSLVVHRQDQTASATATFLGWYLPAPQVLAPLLLAGALVLLFLIINVPPTWRLTRWAWFWIGFTPVGAVLFALFAGPTPGLPRPRHPAERIGGVLAFVVSLVAGGLLHWGSP